MSINDIYRKYYLHLFEGVNEIRQQSSSIFKAPISLNVVKGALSEMDFTVTDDFLAKNGESIVRKLMECNEIALNNSIMSEEAGSSENHTEFDQNLQGENKINNEIDAESEVTAELNKKEVCRGQRMAELSDDCEQNEICLYKWLPLFVDGVCQVIGCIDMKSVEENKCQSIATGMIVKIQPHWKKIVTIDKTYKLKGPPSIELLFDGRRKADTPRVIMNILNKKKKNTASNSAYLTDIFEISRLMNVHLKPKQLPLTHLERIETIITQSNLSMIINEQTRVKMITVDKRIKEFMKNLNKEIKEICKNSQSNLNESNLSFSDFKDNINLNSTLKENVNAQNSTNLPIKDDAENDAGIIGVIVWCIYPSFTKGDLNVVKNSHKQQFKLSGFKLGSKKSNFIQRIKPELISSVSGSQRRIINNKYELLGPLYHLGVGQIYPNALSFDSMQSIALEQFLPNFWYDLPVCWKKLIIRMDQELIDSKYREETSNVQNIFKKPSTSKLGRKKSKKCNEEVVTTSNSPSLPSSHIDKFPSTSQKDPKNQVNCIDIDDVQLTEDLSEKEKHSNEGEATSNAEDIFKKPSPVKCVKSKLKKQNAKIVTTSKPPSFPSSNIYEFTSSQLKDTENKENYTDMDKSITIDITEDEDHCNEGEGTSNTQDIIKKRSHAKCIRLTLKNRNEEVATISISPSCSSSDIDKFPRTSQKCSTKIFDDGQLTEDVSEKEEHCSKEEGTLNADDIFKKSSLVKRGKSNLKKKNDEMPTTAISQTDTQSNSSELFIASSSASFKRKRTKEIIQSSSSEISGTEMNSKVYTKKKSKFDLSVTESLMSRNAVSLYDDSLDIELPNYKVLRTFQGYLNREKNSKLIAMGWKPHDLFGHHLNLSRIQMSKYRRLRVPLKDRDAEVEFVVHDDNQMVLYYSNRPQILIEFP